MLTLTAQLLTMRPQGPYTSLEYRPRNLHDDSTRQKARSLTEIRNKNMGRHFRDSEHLNCDFLG